MQAVFDDSLVTGNEMIDTQHKELIARINKLLLLCENEKPAQREAVETLDYLADYTEFHFAAEEKLQEECGYPLLDAHKAQHAKFVKAVDELREMLEEEEGPSEAFVEAVKKNVVDWLLNHIQVWDKQIAEFIRG